MNAERLAPGIFVTADDSFLYAFLGQEPTCERLNLQVASAHWEYVDVSFPDSISSKYGFTALPIWKHLNLVPSFTLNTVLFFGGHTKEVFKWDIATNKAEVL